MHVCGSHEQAIARFGLRAAFPKALDVIMGPGCPVCVLPIGRIDNAIELASENKAIVCTYADTMRVPASDRSSLLKAKARGADIRMIYSCADAVRIAQENPAREVVFFAIGFETTTPPTAVAIRQAAALGLALLGEAQLKVAQRHLAGPEEVAPLAADRQDLHRLAFGQEPVGMLARDLGDRGIEAAAEAALGSRHDQQVGFAEARAGQQRGRTRLAVHGIGEVGQHRGHARVAQDRRERGIERIDIERG